jgi:uroporphyrin-III C-methyltransferase
VFGRGGEEAEALAAAGIEYSVVPAPTSAIAALAAAGIPVTDRRFSSSVTIVTGHCGGEDALIDWAATARGAQTLVILMGIKNLTGIVRQLVAGGLAPETPAAIVENGTLPSQRVIVSELAALPEKALEENIHSPAVIVVGEVVKMRQLLHNAREKRGHS